MLVFQNDAIILTEMLLRVASNELPNVETVIFCTCPGIPYKLRNKSSLSKIWRNDANYDREVSNQKAECVRLVIQRGVQVTVNKHRHVVDT